MEIEFLEEYTINATHKVGNTAKVHKPLAEELVRKGIAKEVKGSTFKGRGDK